MDLIVSQLLSLVQISPRLQNTVASYLLTLMLDVSKRTLTLASTISGKNKSQFSRLLADHVDLAIDTLVLLGRQFASLAASNRKPLVAGVPWTVALIIDATLHPRSSLHVQNAQRFNHGQGFVIGHQWTNIVLYVSGQLIPLPPIAFLTKSECKRRGVIYRSEHEILAEYLGSLQLAKYLGSHLSEEIVVLSDSGYDNKKIQRLVVDRGWGFVSSLKSCRGTQTSHESINSAKTWRSIANLFRAVKKTTPWTKVRIETDDKGKKRRKTFRARKLTGRIKGVNCDVSLVCSEKTNGKGRRYFACSDTKISVGAIVRVYRIRWQIELFHRAIKSQLGLLDAAVADFRSLTSHLHWVYSAWLLLHKITIPDKSVCLIAKQRYLREQVYREPLIKDLRKILAARTQFGGLYRQKDLARAVMQQSCAA